MALTIKQINALKYVNNNPNRDHKHLYSDLYPLLGKYVTWQLGHGFITQEGIDYLNAKSLGIQEQER